MFSTSSPSCLFLPLQVRFLLEALAWLVLLPVSTFYLLCAATMAAAKGLDLWALLMAMAVLHLASASIIFSPVPFAFTEEQKHQAASSRYAVVGTDTEVRHRSAACACWSWVWHVKP
jgi:hypothetical protein